MAIEDVIMALLQNRMQIDQTGQQPGIPADVPRKPSIDNRWYDQVQSPGQVTMLPQMPPFRMGML